MTTIVGRPYSAAPRSRSAGACGVGSLALELQLLDARAAPGDLVGRDQHLRDIVAHLGEMLLQIADAVTQPDDVGNQRAALGADQVRLPRASAHP